MVDDNKEVSNIFNNYFAEVARNLNMNIPLNNKDPLFYIAMNPLSFMRDPTSPNEITTVIDSMKNKKFHIDDIPVYIYKHIVDLIAVPISDLINKSFSLGIFPN